MLLSDKAGSRGLDLPNVSHVVQFDFAKSSQDFLHRVGRTGRLGAPGRVTSFIRPRDSELYAKIMEKKRLDEPLEATVMKKRNDRKV